MGRRVAVCTLHLVWDPMGSKVMCEPPPPGKVSSSAGWYITSWICLCLCYIGDCADFGALANGTVIFSNSTENASVIKFQCGTGFFLVGSNVAQCRSGQWSVQPQDVQCTSHPLTSQGEFIYKVILCFYQVWFYSVVQFGSFNSVTTTLEHHLHH